MCICIVVFHNDGPLPRMKLPWPSRLRRRWRSGVLLLCTARLPPLPAWPWPPAIAHNAVAVRSLEKALAACKGCAIAIQHALLVPHLAILSRWRLVVAHLSGWGWASLPSSLNMLHSPTNALVTPYT